MAHRLTIEVLEKVKGRRLVVQAKDKTTMNIALPRNLKQMIKQVASQDGRSASNWIVWVLGQEIMRRVGTLTSGQNGLTKKDA